MPRAPKRCVRAGCPRPAILGGRCDRDQLTERYVAAWEGSTHGPTNTQAWRILRKKIIQRDHGICAWCGTYGATHMDHIIPTAEGGTDAEENLQVLCATCHGKKTAQEGVRGRARKRNGGADPLAW